MSVDTKAEIVVPLDKSQVAFTAALKSIPLGPDRVNLTFSALGIQLPEDKEDDDDYYERGAKSGLVPGSSAVFTYTPDQGLFSSERVEYKVGLGSRESASERSLSVADAFLSGNRTHEIDVRVRGLEFRPEAYRRFADTYLDLFAKRGYNLRSGSVWLAHGKAPDYSGSDVAIDSGIRLSHRLHKQEGGTVYEGRIELIMGSRLPQGQQDTLQNWFTTLKSYHSPS